MRRLGGMGYTGQIAQIHGGMHYTERQEQVERFRKPCDEGGARFMICTDAAGEGINLQFCWIMINYDVPWNPARLEQRMGRIHRYGQKHDPVDHPQPRRAQDPRRPRPEDASRQAGDDPQAAQVATRSSTASAALRGRLHQAVHGDGRAWAILTQIAASIGWPPDQRASRGAAERERRLYGDGGDVAEGTTAPARKHRTGDVLPAAAGLRPAVS